MCHRWFHICVEKDHAELTHWIHRVLYSNEFWNECGYYLSRMEGDREEADPRTCSKWVERHV
jgi:hypothetical protein